MEMSILQTLGLLASLIVGSIGIIKWLITRMDTGTEGIKASVAIQLATMATKQDSLTAALADVRVNYANKQELTSVVQMFQSSMDRQSVETSRAMDSITSRIDNLINIVTKQHA